MNKRVITILLLLLSFPFFEARASHIVGGEFVYKYMGDSTAASGIYYRYQVTLSIYEDCQNGQAGAISQDNPAFFSAYPVNSRIPFDIDTAVFFTTYINVPVNFSNACVSNIPPTCLLKKTFIKNYAFPRNSTGYIVAYQRCCRNNAVANIYDPGDGGSTYFCYIPPTPNTSAIFRNYPPQIICLDNPLVYDNSATDADGDSLSYGFTAALDGASSSVVKPVAAPPPYDSVAYLPGYSSQNPFPGYPPIHINPVTGIITGTPNRIGRYLVTVYCNEYRDGVLINVNTREFQFVVTDCSKVVVADIPQLSSEPNTYIVDCNDYTINFLNTSKGGFSWMWNFGLVGVANDTSTAEQPTFVYPDTGTFDVKLVVNPGTTCPDSIDRLVKVFPKFHANFTDSGNQCPGSALLFKDLSSATIKPITYWRWTFGDGDSSFIQNPVHTYTYGGTYNVTLVSQNIKGCSDTTLQGILIENFRPFAGNDTVIVKDESLQFNASGGIKYTWSPPTYLNDTTGNAPVGFFPDTGRFDYYVKVDNAFGCTGLDTVQVYVVSQAEFFVPTAFTPNGDGKNDYFKPVAVGYQSLNYFKVFNRWGEIVYNGNSLDAGWDGTYKNVKADIGTYFWEMSFTNRYGVKGYLKGDVTLLR